jgi:hypothetical protein
MSRDTEREKRQEIIRVSLIEERGVHYLVKTSGRKRRTVGRKPQPGEPRPTDTIHWVDRIAGTLDEDFARAALDRPGPDSYQRREIKFD